MRVAILPAPLEHLLMEHAVAHAPHYPPSDNSDHGPMAYLAMHGLGIPFQEITAFAERYRAKLVAAPPPKEAVSAVGWKDHIGRRESYSALLGFFSAEIAAHGWQFTLHRFLPSLISGWVKDAFHPLIRLGYGIEFEVRSEIAAGLAYLTITGDDSRMALVAKAPPTDAQGREFLVEVQSMRNPRFVSGTFNERYTRILKGAPLRPTESTPKEIGRACLEVFDATHDFFALHLVTAGHAFRICAPWAGPQPGLLFSAGIATAYLAIGAPRFDALADRSARLPIASLSRVADEHDVKLAYSCRSHAQAYTDTTYEWVAARYLATRLPATR